MNKRPYGIPFWERKTIQPNGCWEWVGSKRRYGYGQVYYKGKPGVKAHKVAWELTYGPIPKGLCVLHKCDNPSCINPGHLLLGTQLDNIKDMTVKGRWNVNGPRGRTKRTAECHPDKPNHSHGLCKICNQKRLRKIKREAECHT